MSLAPLTLWQRTGQSVRTSREAKHNITHRPSYYLAGSWVISLVLIGSVSQLLFSLSYSSWIVYSDVIYRSGVSLFLCSLLVLTALALDQSKKQLLKYVLFFSIT